MAEQKHKTLRSFYCEDNLWEMFEVMTRDLDCSMDYLINESMRHYARSRNYSLTGMSRLRQPDPVFQQPGYAAAPQPQAYAPPAYAPPQPQRPQPSVAAQAGADSRTIPLQAYAPPAAPQEWNGGTPGYAPAYRPPSAPRVPPPPPPRPAARPPQPPPAAPRQPPAPPVASPQTAEYAPLQQRRAPAAPAGRMPLYLFFNGQRYLVDKERFIIGRGSQNTDLTIRDGNISRRHAAVIYHDGAFYIQDLGSTNGIEYKNAKVASKQIEEGDLFNICDYELRFSYVG